MGPTAPSDAFQVMERLRARGLLETLLAEGEPVPPVPTVAQVQAALAPHEALVSFQVWRAEPSAEGALPSGLLVGDAGHRPRRGGGADCPMRTCSSRRSAPSSGCSRRATARRGEAGNGWEPTLLRPAARPASAPTSSRWCWSRMGCCTGCPFDALSAGPGAPYLAERFRLSVRSLRGASGSSSATGHPARLPGAALVLADPAGRRSPGAVAIGAGRGRHRGSGVLRHARGEARAALAAFPPRERAADRSGRLRGLLEVRGSPALFLLHLATHAVADTHDPERSSVVLAAGAGEDGRLEPEGDRPPPAPGPDGGAGGVRDVGRHRPPRRRGDEPGPGLLQRRGGVGGGHAQPRPGRRDGGLLLRALPEPGARGWPSGEAVADAKRRLIARGAPPAAWADVVLLGDA